MTTRQTGVAPCGGGPRDNTFPHQGFEPGPGIRFSDISKSLCTGGDGVAAPCTLTAWDSSGNGVWAMNRTYTEPAEHGPGSEGQLTVNITLTHTPG